MKRLTSLAAWLDMLYLILITLRHGAAQLNKGPPRDTDIRKQIVSKQEIYLIVSNS